MLSILLALIVAATLASGPFWRRDKEHLPLHFWAIYCGFGPATAFGVEPLAYRWVMGLAIGGVGVWWYVRRHPWTIDTMMAMPLLMIAWALSSSIYSDLPEYSIARAVALLPMYATAFLGVRTLLRQDRGVENVANSLLTLVWMSLAVSIAYWITGIDNVGTSQEYRASDDYRFHGHWKATGMAHLLASALPFLCLPLTRSAGWRRYALLAFSAFIIYLLLITRSRAGLLGAVAVLPIGYFAILRGMQIVRITVSTLTAALAAIILWQAFATEKAYRFLRIEDATSMLSSRVDGRWDIIWRGALESPWVGHGYGTVRYVNQSGAKSWHLSASTADHVHTHNEYLSLFYDLGVVPALAFAAFMAVIAVRGVKLLRYPASRIRNLLVATFLSWFITAVDTVTHDGLMTIGNPGSTWFWIKSLMIYYGYEQLRAAEHSSLGHPSGSAAQGHAPSVAERFAVANR